MRIVRLSFVFATLFLIASCTLSLAATYWVTSTGDAPTGGTLRWAIRSANTNAGADSIYFSVGGAISPTGELPMISDDFTTISGGSSPNVELNGGSARRTGLQIFSADNCLIEGLIIHGYTNLGVTIGGHNSTLRSCHILNNRAGVYVSGTNNTVGGIFAGNRNVISSNDTFGVELWGPSSRDNLVIGNYIGTDPTGSNDWGNVTGSGVWIQQARSNTIGGATAAERNIISGNGAGVTLNNTNARHNRVWGNYIGTDASGRYRIQNNYGVVIEYAQSNQLGGSVVGMRNVIVSRYDNVSIRRPEARGNVVEGNYIGVSVNGSTVHTNQLSGIEIDDSPGNKIGGPNDRRNVIGGAYVGIYIFGNAARGNVIEGNHIGVTAVGNSSAHNRYSNIYIDGAPETTIGGDKAGAGNVISGSDGSGIEVRGAEATGTTIQGNIIGLDATGSFSVSNDTQGITITTASNKIGGFTVNARNIISGNDGEGIYLIGADAHHNIVRGNYIGLNSAGTAAVGNDIGIRIVGASNNTVGGISSTERNVISGNRDHGISLSDGAAENSFENNYIGTDAAGTSPIANGLDGIFVNDGGDNLIGRQSAGNTIAGNFRYGVNLEWSTGTVVRYNEIGTDGVGAIPNGDTGVYGYESPETVVHDNVVAGNLGDGVNLRYCPLSVVSTNHIGITTLNAPVSNNNTGIKIERVSGTPIHWNYIAANGEHGVYLSHATNCTVYANWIGTDLNGALDYGNGEVGVEINPGSSNFVMNNLISGNGDDGVEISGTYPSSHNEILGNLIGCNVAGNAPLPNDDDGIVVWSSPYNVIGTTNYVEQNIISGNLGNGIVMGGSGSHGNVVRGNHIGTDGVTNGVPNMQCGIYIYSTASNNVIGGGAQDQGNTIAFNSNIGVYIYLDQPKATTILGNSIHDNGGLGIDLYPPGPTLNDNLDPDVGANNKQNFPVLLSCSNNGAAMRVTGYLNSIPSSAYTIELFGGWNVGGTGYGEGEELLSTFLVLTPPGGTIGFTNIASTPTVPPNFITATATRQVGANGETSEFSYRIMLDSDGDGMPDGFEHVFFGGYTAGDPTGDADNDKVLNLGEFLADTDPQGYKSFQHFTDMRLDYGEPVWRGTYSPHRTYTLWRCMDLTGVPSQDWYFRDIDIDPISDTEAEYRDANPLDDDPSMYQLRSAVP